MAVEICLLTSLWGNKMDLSLWPSSQQSGERIAIGEAMLAMRPLILDDHLEEVVSHLVHHPSGGGGRVDIIVDNAGYELVSDLILAHGLISLGIASSVVLHTKGHPTFVSDATTADVLGTVSFLMASHHADVKALGEALQGHLNDGRLLPQEDLFWCQPLAFWDMPAHIQQRLEGSILVIVKGDANYRRLLGDRSWDLVIPAKDVLSYWPVPVCALRALKAEVGCGLTYEAQRRASAADNAYLVSGQWAVVQYFNPSTI